ncbi:MAG: hypothetical protein AAF543_00920 [Pseudomonadota bacterium]
MTRTLATLGLLAGLAACTAAAPQQQSADIRNSELTHGNVQMQLEVGRTTQADVLDTFGAPNVTTIDGSGQEVWSYQRAATVTQSSSRDNYWTILLAGGGSDSSGFEQSSRMTTLIVKFDDRDVVADFRSRSSSF